MSTDRLAVMVQVPMRSRWAFLRKIAVSTFVGGVTLAATSVADQDPVLSWLLSVFASGVALVVQFLVDIESRFDDLRRDVINASDVSKLISRAGAGQLSRDAVLELVTHAVNFDVAAPPIARQMAEDQIRRTSDLVRDINHGRQIAYEGDEWSWCMSLVATANLAVDATTYLSSDDGTMLVDDDLWFSELGQHYLELQGEAIKRGVAVRRIVILDKPELVGHPQVVKLLALQNAIGIQARVLDARAALNAAGRLVPMVIFDSAILLELTPTRFRVTPGHVRTTLVFQPDHVKAMTERFNRLWQATPPT